MDAQGSQTNAKEDTALLLLAGNLTTDLSQELTDLTAMTGGGYEASSARTALTSRRTLYIRFELADSKDTGTLLVHGPTAQTDFTYGMSVSGDSRFACYQNNALVWEGSVVEAKDYSFSWATRANPDTTGASDAAISEVVVYNHTDGVLVHLEQFTHAVASTDNAWYFNVGGWWNGATVDFSTPDPPTACRVSSSFHPHTEVLEDWISSRSVHVTSLDTPEEPIGAGASGLGGQGEWAGQANVGFIGAHANALRGRMLSPLVNEVYHQAGTLRNTYVPVNRHISAPDSTYQMDSTKLRWLPSPSADYVYVRVQVQSWVTAGAAVPVAVRCYSMNRPHVGLGLTLDNKPIPPLAFNFAEGTLTEDHGSSGEGEWLNLGILKLSKLTEQIEGWTNTTTLCLAYLFDPNAESANDANARLKIKAWQVRPLLGTP